MNTNLKENVMSCARVDFSPKRPIIPYRHIEKSLDILGDGIDHIHAC